MVLEQEPPSGRYFGTVPVGVSACPLMPGLPYAGGGAAVSWLYAVDSLGLVPLTGMHRGGFTGSSELSVGDRVLVGGCG